MNTAVEIVVAVIVSGALSAFVSALLTHKREGKKDKAADWAAFAELVSTDRAEYSASLLERVRKLETRLDLLEAKREEDAIIKRKMGDHIDLLEQHIWDGKPPPPPARPEGI